MELTVGLEPTSSLKRDYLRLVDVSKWLQRMELHHRPFGYEPNELLLLHSAIKWCCQQESNPRHPDYKSGALPTEL